MTVSADARDQAFTGGRPRLIRQLLTESLLLALMGFAIGLGVAYGGIRFLQTIPPADQVVIAPQLDQRVLLFGLFVAAVSAMVSGLAPARQSLKTDLVPGLKTSEPGEAARQRAAGRNLLVIAQIALSMVLLIADQGDPRARLHSRGQERRSTLAAWPSRRATSRHAGFAGGSSRGAQVRLARLRSTGGRAQKSRGFGEAVSRQKSC